MTRIFSGLMVLAITSGAAGQQVTTIRLTLHPAPEPVPALKYHFLPVIQDKTPGNAALWYYRAFSPEWLSHPRIPGYYGKLEGWKQMAPGKLSSQELAWLKHYGPLRELDLAARREECEWQLTERIRNEGVNMLLPDVQGFRDLANLLAIRTRLEIGQKNFNQAIYTLQTGYQMARHINRNPLLIANLVGIAIAHLMCEQVEACIQEPGAPNLYWALTELPQPFSDLREALQGDQLGLTALLPSLEALEKGPMNESQLEESLGKLLQILRYDNANVPDRGFIQKLYIAGLTAKFYAPAKQFLIGRGRSQQQIESMPALQVVMLYSIYQYQQLRDNWYKWMNLPYWQAYPGLQLGQTQLLKAKREMQEGIPIASVFLPAVNSVVLAKVRIDRRIAALRCVEAVRMHAAMHDNELPQKLNLITVVPIPVDPMTGQPFEYKVEGDHAVLYGPPAPGEPAQGPYNTLRYELRIKS